MIFFIFDCLCGHKVTAAPEIKISHVTTDGASQSHFFAKCDNCKKNHKVTYSVSMNFIQSEDEAGNFSGRITA